MLTPHERKNRRSWDANSAEYQRMHAEQLRRGEVWGVWSIPETDIQAIGDVADRDVLELGCGGAQWSIALTRRGARCTGLDLSEAQLAYARDLSRAVGAEVNLVHGSAEALPFADASFDLVFCDHGAMTFADPHRTVPEVARVLRPGGRFVFNHSTPLRDICWNEATDVVTDRLRMTYYGMHRLDEPDAVYFQLTYSDWIRLFRANGLQVEDLIELRPPVGATTTYTGFVSREWAQRWPAEQIWVCSKARG